MSEVVSRLVALLYACAEHLGRAAPEGFAASIEARTSE